MDIYGYKFVNIIETKPLCHIGITDLSGVVCFFIRLEQSVFINPWFRPSVRAWTL